MADDIKLEGVWGAENDGQFPESFGRKQIVSPESHLSGRLSSFLGIAS